MIPRFMRSLFLRFLSVSDWYRFLALPFRLVLSLISNREPVIWQPAPNMHVQIMLLCVGGSLENRPFVSQAEKKQQSASLSQWRVKILKNIFGVRHRLSWVPLEHNVWRKKQDKNNSLSVTVAANLVLKISSVGVVMISAGQKKKKNQKRLLVTR